MPRWRLSPTPGHGQCSLPQTPAPSEAVSAGQHNIYTVTNPSPSLPLTIFPSLPPTSPSLPLPSSSSLLLQYVATHLQSLGDSDLGLLVHGWPPHTTRAGLAHLAHGEA